MDYKEFFTTNNNSGWKSVANKLKKNEPDVYNEVIKYGNTHKLNDLPFKEIVYCFINNLTERPKCLECGEKVKYRNITLGFQEFCSIKCSNKNSLKQDKVKKTNNVKYGGDTPMHDKVIKDKIKTKNKNKYGVDNYFKRDTFSKERKEIMLSKYGVEYPTQSDEFKDKIVKTNLGKYNNPTYLGSEIHKEKTIKKLIDKYGVDNYFKTEEFKVKYKEIMLEKYGVSNPIFNEEIKNKIESTNLKKFGKRTYFGSEKHKNKYKEIMLEKYGAEHPLHVPEIRNKIIKKNSKYELLLKEKLNADHKFIYNNKEYDLKIGADIIEVDGDYFHVDKISELSLTQLNTVINDKIKYDDLNNSEYNLHKIKTSVIDDLGENISLDTIKNNAYRQDFSIGYRTKILTKDYLIEYRNKYGEEKLESYIPLLLKFVRTFQPELPILPNDENIIDIQNSIGIYDVDKIYNEETKCFNNNCSIKGVNYLKHHFKGYWDSSYNGMMSPREAWLDDHIMYKVIKYRIGLNQSNETFDFSLYELMRGLSARRFTISFFKPVLAAAIYEKYLDNKRNPTVFDPCGGFGGRLLGFKGKYPNGTYIACEPNKDTYNVLDNMFNDGKTHIHNLKLEEFDVKSIEYDIAFTSIPYFDLEIYSEHIDYGSFDKWKTEFIATLLSIPRLLVNMSYKLCEDLNLVNYVDTYLESNISHLNKGKKKKEVILKLNF